MNIFDLEKMAREKKDKFIKFITEIEEKDGIDEALKMLKKSGICINEFGTGKAKDSNLYKKIINRLLLKVQNTEIVMRFDAEANIINKFYKQISDILKKDVDDRLPIDTHMASYLIALEIFLTNCNYKSFLETLNLKSTGLSNKAINVYESVIDATGVIMKYLIFKGYTFSNINTKIESDNIEIAIQYIYLSSLRKTIKNIEHLWSYFEVNISNVEGVTKFKAIGNHALGKNISAQVFFDIRNVKIERSAYKQFHFNKKYTINDILPPYNYISSDEELTCEFIKEYFSISDLTLEFNEITLSEMVRAYTVIRNEATAFIKKRKLNNTIKKISISDICIVRTKNKWIKIFNKFGIRKCTAERIIKLLTFDGTSVDLYDCPFIKFGDLYVIVPSAAYSTDPSRAIMSNLNSKEIDISIKGDMFEEYIREIIRNSGRRCIPLHEKKGTDEYECDAVFVIDNDLFLVETKHLNHPLNYRDYQRNLDEIEDACNQLTRICNYFTKDINTLKDKFGLDVINNVHKIIVTNTANGEKLSFDDCIITDETLFCGYFKRQPAAVHEIKNNVIVTEELFSQFYKGEINARQFIKFLQKSPLIDLYKKRVSYEIFDSFKSFGFILVDYDSKIDTFVPLDTLTTEELNKVKDVYKIL